MANIRMLILFVTLVIRCENIRYNTIFVLVQSSYAFRADKLPYTRLKDYNVTLGHWIVFYIAYIIHCFTEMK